MPPLGETAIKNFFLSISFHLFIHPAKILLVDDAILALRDLVYVCAVDFPRPSAVVRCLQSLTIGLDDPL